MATGEAGNWKNRLKVAQSEAIYAAVHADKVHLYIKYI
jgi:hypothetical protein